MVGRIRAIGVALAALASGMLAASSAQAAYTYDRTLYGRLHVDLTYGQDGAPIQLLADCPKGSGWDPKDKLKDLLKGDQTLNLGFAVATPDGKLFQFAPVEISIKKKAFGSAKCNLKINQIHYVSPLYALKDYSGQKFTVSPIIYVRKKPTTDLIVASKALATGVAALLGVPAPLAKSASDSLGSSLEGSGPNVSAVYGADLLFQPRPDHPEDSEKTWEAPAELLSSVKALKIEAKFENVASVVRPDLATFDTTTFAKVTPTEILGAQLKIGDANDGLSTVRKMVATTVSANDLTSFNSKQTAAEAKDACKNIATKLEENGFTPIDQALVVWALIREQPLIGSSVEKDKNLDQNPCLADRKAILVSGGLDLRPIPQEPPQQVADKAKYNPPTDRMKVALETNGALAQFGLRADSLERAKAAAQVFVDKPTLQDVKKIAFVATEPVTMTTNNDWRYHQTKPDLALFKRIGCYAYVPSNTLAPTGPAVDGSDASHAWAIAISQADGEIALYLTFATSSADAAAKVIRVEVLDTLPTGARAAIQKARGGDGCGDDGSWKPSLLFG